MGCALNRHADPHWERLSLWHDTVDTDWTPRPGLTGDVDADVQKAIKSIDLDDVQKLVEAQMKNLTDPLEAKIQTTTSWWELATL